MSSPVLPSWMLAAPAALEAPSPGTPPVLLGCGNANVDLTCVVSENILAETGLRVGSEAAGLSDAEKARIVELAAARSTSCEVLPGGAAMNATRVATWCAAGKLRSGFLGCVGTDSNAEVLKTALREAGVLPLLKVTEGIPTGMCAVLVEEKSRDRTLSMVRGASAALDPEHLQSHAVRDFAEQASLIYVTSFVLTSEPRLSTARQLVVAATNSKAKFALNLSSAAVLPKVFKVVVEELLPRASFVFGNRGELRCFAGLIGWKSASASATVQQEDFVADSDIVLQLTKLIAHGGFVVITGGKEATLVGSKTEGEVASVEVPVIDPSTILDTNGAGDAFVGGFIAGLSKGHTLASAVALGHRCAAMILSRHGCDLRQLSPPSVDAAEST